jgi:hypothetical protein
VFFRRATIFLIELSSNLSLDSNFKGVFFIFFFFFLFFICRSHNCSIPRSRLIRRILPFTLAFPRQTERRKVLKNHLFHFSQRDQQTVYLIRHFNKFMLSLISVLYTANVFDNHKNNYKSRY